MHSPQIISLSLLSLATDVTDATLGASGLWLGTRTGAGGTATLTESLFWPQPMAPWTTGLLCCFILLHFNICICRSSKCVLKKTPTCRTTISVCLLAAVSLLATTPTSETSLHCLWFLPPGFHTHVLGKHAHSIR